MCLLISAPDPHAAGSAADQEAVHLAELRLGVLSVPQIRTPLGRLQIITPLLGAHNVSNVLAAVAGGIAAGASLVDIVAGIEAVDVIPGRSEILDEVRRSTCC